MNLQGANFTGQLGGASALALKWRSLEAPAGLVRFPQLSAQQLQWYAQPGHAQYAMPGVCNACRQLLTCSGMQSPQCEVFQSIEIIPRVLCSSNSIPSQAEYALHACSQLLPYHALVYCILPNVKFFHELALHLDHPQRAMSRAAPMV